jgi:hypothetical protein
MMMMRVLRRGYRRMFRVYEELSAVEPERLNP